MELDLQEIETVVRHSINDLHLNLRHVHNAEEVITDSQGSTEGRCTSRERHGWMACIAGTGVHIQVLRVGKAHFGQYAPLGTMHPP